MTDDEIEAIANHVLTMHEINEAIPVDPFFIATEEEIELLSGEYDNSFDGRIEYRRTEGLGHFYLFYAAEQLPFRPQARVRFSIAHELGHFYLPEHRTRLLNGESHGSQSDFTSKKVRENEADRFAAMLLMPRELFEDEVRRRDDFCTLKDLQWLASNVFETSLTSTILRYVELNFEPCCVVMAEAGQIAWSKCSADMRDQGLGWTEWGSALPAGSITARAKLSKLSGTQLTSEGGVDSSVWFSRRNSCRLWEETYLLSHGGRTLTYLSLENKPSRYDD